MTSPRIHSALVSVSDKSRLVEFAQGLVAAGVAIYSTGGTRRHLEQAGIAVRDVAAYTGFPEMMDGRLKTLHPKVFGGILCRHDRPEDLAALAEHGIVSFELVVVNLYPFAATVARPGVTLPEAIEQIDIGGPSLVRAAAKNHAFTTIATAPDQYAEILAQIQASGGTTAPQRFRLAAAAFDHTAGYDRAIADYFARQVSPPADDAVFPPQLNLALTRRAVLRYGENPHQRAALYARSGAGGFDLVSARQLAGKDLSYNNLLDLNSALAMARSLADVDRAQAGAVVIKHNNPCGAAIADALAVAMRRALDGDPTSAFGSVIGVNRPLDAATAEVLAEPNRFVEAIVAPDFDDDALRILTTKPKWKANVRLMAVGGWEASDREASDQEGGHWAVAGSEQEIRHIAGGFLVQDADDRPDPADEWRVATAAQPSEAQLADLRFAWAVVRHVKSNAIVVVKDRALCGVGAGQMSRVDSVEIAIRKAGNRAGGGALASDAFFPFADSIQHAAAAGVAALIQPGGSRRDDEVIAACNERRLSMILTGRRHFQH
jgi:phosphoribosylaminoimidazolecarboxamide formyltransferase/IMP cyclohydrolase